MTRRSLVQALVTTAAGAPAILASSPVSDVRVRDVAFEDMSIAGNQGWSFLVSNALDVAQLVLDADSGTT